MTPDLQPDVSVIEVLLYSVFNPATAVVAFLMGRAASEKAKLLIAGFAGAIAGVALLNLAALLHIFDAPNLGRASGGVFAASLLTGTIYAALGSVSKR